MADSGQEFPHRKATIMMYRVREQLFTGRLVLQTQDEGGWRDVADLARGERFHIVTESEAVKMAAELAYYKAEIVALSERAARPVVRASAPA